MVRLGENLKMILWSCFAIFAAVSAQGYRAPTVEVEPRGETVVRVGNRLRVMCRVGVPLVGCRVEIPGLPSIVLKPNERSDDGINYDGEGLQSGQCGVNIENVKDSFHGDFKCALQPQDSRSETVGTLKIIVAKPPNQPELILSQAPGERYKKGDRIEMSCSALSGRPSAKVSLFIDNETISRDNSRLAYNSNDNSLSMVNASRTLDWSDNGRTIRCVATHMALDAPRETRRQLDVNFPPQEQPTIERFGYVIGRPGIINATVYANPKPNFVWQVGDEQIMEGRTDLSQRLQTTTARESQKTGQWYVELKIDSVQKSDTEKFYVLEARNTEGTTKYHFRLSTSPEPEGFDLDAGYIIGIVVGILVLLLLISLIIFARATGRWCFAGGATTRNIGESDIGDPAASIRLLRFYKPKTGDANSGQRSDTESAGRYSRSETDGSGRPRRPKIMLSQLFKRNKDKVAGSDTDTMRTVVTVDDEKMPESADVTHKNQEGGLVYAELDLTQREATPPRRVSEDKTEYAEILYPKSGKEGEETAEKK